MTKAVLKSTNNATMQQYVGLEGMLEKGPDGKFHFHFVDGSGQKKDLCSSVVSELGSLEHPSSKEVCFNTRNSVYVFEKKENVHESLYDWTKGSSLDGQIKEATNECEQARLQREAYERVFGSNIKQNNGMEKGF